MAVDEASYREWSGQAAATHRVVFAIAGTMIRRLMKWRLVRYICFMAPLGACLLAAIVLTVFHEGEARMPMLMRFQQVGMEPQDILAVLNRWFQGWVGFFAFLLAALVGAPLVAEDRRTRALALYFSRPISHVDYVVGKFLTIAFFLSLLVILPPVLMYLLDVGFSDEEGVLVARLPILARSLVPGLLQVMVLGVVALGVSSLSRRTPYAALLFFGLILMSNVLAQLLARQVFADPAWLALSPSQSVRRIAFDVLPVRGPLAFRGRHLQSMDVGLAWLSVGLWTAAGLAVLVARIRRVEVVT
ncbi:MAG: ABC transporter permease [Planctomycetota bacterium]